MAKHQNILVQPLVTEKTVKQEKANKYSFVVAPDANKIEIKHAVEEYYSVTVTDVNTMHVPAKKKSQYRNGRMAVGYKNGFKKAIVTLTEGEYINFYGDSEAAN
jgi:large subunit ribosomal protein L23